MAREGEQFHTAGCHIDGGGIGWESTHAQFCSCFFVDIIFVLHLVFFQSVYCSYRTARIAVVLAFFMDVLWCHRFFMCQQSIFFSCAGRIHTTRGRRRKRERYRGREQERIWLDGKSYARILREEKREPPVVVERN